MKTKAEMIAAAKAAYSDKVWVSLYTLKCYHACHHKTDKQEATEARAVVFALDELLENMGITEKERKALFDEQARCYPYLDTDILFTGDPIE